MLAPPAELLACAPAPVPPATPATMEQMLVYMAALYFAGADCRANLAGVAQWTAENAAP